MKVFVTGATGFIGGTVARQLRDRGDEVVCLVRSPEKAADADRDRLRDRRRRPRRPRGDPRRDGGLRRRHPRRRDVRGRHPQVPAPGDVRGQRRRHRKRARRGARKPKIPKIVYVSTCGAFGNTHHQIVDESYEHPGEDFTSYYEQTKVEAHKVAKRMIAEDGLPCVIVQPGGVYGPGDTSQLGDLLEQFLERQDAADPLPRAGHLPRPRRGHRRRDRPRPRQGPAGRDLRDRRPADDDARGGRDRRQGQRPQGAQARRADRR